MNWTAKREPDGYWYVYDDNDEGQFFFETKKADVARLIAAAPDMLTILQWLDGLGGLGPHTHKRLREVIAKATGEA